MKLLLGGLLALSLALNIFLWSRLSSQSNQLKSAQTSASEIDELRRQNQELQTNRPSAPDSARADPLELARLRNEVGQQVSYRFLNANGNENDPNKPLATCPIHGHVGLSDGSVHRR